MARPFDLFVILAGMRTGSNFLETNLDALKGVRCFGEAFNPHFIGYPKARDILGFTQAERDAHPARLLEAIRKQGSALGGFRYFHDHDPRILDEILDDHRCAKIILGRNLLDSYVSKKIAQTTGQWKLTDTGSRRTAKAVFDAEEFTAHLDEDRQFRGQLRRHLQRTGQTAFHVDYSDLQDVSVINGIAAFLGVADRLASLDRTMKVQNPGPLRDKVENVAEMEAALAALDPLDLARAPEIEPRRGPAVPSYIAATSIPLLFLPIPGGPTDEVRAWLQAVDGSGGQPLSGLRQKDLRNWKATHTGHRCFTVLRHPVARAHHAFCTRILSNGPGSLPRIRRTLVRQHQLPVPEEGVGEGWSVTEHRAAFARFLTFLKANLRARTAIRTHASWASQAAVLQGFGESCTPDFVLRETDLARDLPDLARRVGLVDPWPFRPDMPGHPVALQRIYDDEIETLARAAYQRDYTAFGFGRWSGP